MDGFVPSVEHQTIGDLLPAQPDYLIGSASTTQEVVRVAMVAVTITNGLAAGTSTTAVGHGTKGKASATANAKKPHRTNRRRIRCFMRQERLTDEKKCSPQNKGGAGAAVRMSG